MKHQISLEESQIQELTDFYSAKKKSLLDKMVEINNEIKKADSILESLRIELSRETKTSIEKITQQTIQYNDGYHLLVSKSDKAEWVLDKVGKLLTVTEILEIIGDKEPHLFKGDDKAYRVYNSQMSSTLWTRIKDKKVFYREKNKDGIFIYGLIKWNKKAPN